MSGWLPAPCKPSLLVLSDQRTELPINLVQALPYAGSLEPDEAAELFLRLMEWLQPRAWRPPFRKFRAIVRGYYTPPSRYNPNVYLQAVQAAPLGYLLFASRALLLASSRALFFRFSSAWILARSLAASDC